METQWRHRMAALVVGTALLGSTSAWAGLKTFGTVVVQPAEGIAQGALGTTRQGANNMQIGCETQITRDPTTGVVTQAAYCEATDKHGTTLACSSIDPEFVRVVQALRGYGWVHFRANANGTCQALTVKIGSASLPDELAAPEEPGELRGIVSHVQRPSNPAQWDYNRCVPDPVRQVQNLVPVGEIMGFRMGAEHPAPDCPDWIGCKSHWQGIQRLPVADGRHFAVSSSKWHWGPWHDNKALLAVVHIESGLADDCRLGGNRMSTTDPDWDIVPPTADRIIHSQVIDADYWHPSGMQTLGRYLFVSLEEGPGNAKVVAYDMNAPTTPVEHWRLTLDADEDDYYGAAAVAAAKLNDERYLLVVSPTRDDLAFYISQSNKSIAEDGVFAGAKSAYFHKSDNADFRTYYQNINLLTACGEHGEESGQLYLLGTTAGDDSGTDRVDLFELTIRPGGDARYDGTTHTVQLVRRATKVMHCTAGESSGRQCNFDTAAGAYVDRDGRLFLYATEHDNDGPWPWNEFPQGPQYTGDFWSVKMMEYRPVDHLDNPDTPEVEGCSSLAEAFVELHGEDSDEVLLIEGHAMERRNYRNFEDAYDMNDNVHALRHCIPRGHKFVLYEHDDYGGRQREFYGTGQIETPWLYNNLGWSSGCFMDSDSGPARTENCCSSIRDCPDVPPRDGGGGGGDPLPDPDPIPDCPLPAEDCEQP